jgi:hypothetical protein
MKLPNTFVHFIILSLFLGTLACDDDDPPSLCYVAEISEADPVDVNRRGFTRFNYDDQNRITSIEVRHAGANCISPTRWEMVWENDRITKLIEHRSYGVDCDRHTAEHKISYENDLVAKINDVIEFTYDDLRPSEIYFPGLRLTYTFKYDSHGNVQSQTVGTDLIEYSYDNNPNYLLSIVEGLGDQPVLAYYIYFGTAVLSANNVVREKGPFVDRTISYGINENKFVIEQFETNVDGLTSKILTMEYGACK